MSNAKIMANIYLICQMMATNSTVVRQAIRFRE